MDARDWAVLILVGGGFVASWVYVFIHPCNQAYLACLGSTGAFGAVFHWIVTLDDKNPDERNKEG